jgi:hypothetical protein
MENLLSVCFNYTTKKPAKPGMARAEDGWYFSFYELEAMGRMNFLNGSWL